MNKATTYAGTVQVAMCTSLLGALIGCTTYVEQPRPREVYMPPPVAYVPPPAVEAPPQVVYAPPPPVYVPPPVIQVEVVIRTEHDFDEPLSQYGRWEVIGSNGRCWVPSRVESDWRPYCHGNWQRTDAGWYWVSDEPWAWATYHYGRWDLSPEYGWYWVPQTQWAPAWVSWHEGGGYVGWAPLPPSARFSSRGSVEFEEARVAPRAYVFVEPRHFLEPVRPTTVVVNNTTVINNTVNITNIKVVNNTVINEGPRTEVVEKASGRKLQAVPVRELRRKQEAPVIAQQKLAAQAPDKKTVPTQTPAPGRTDPSATTSVPFDAQRRAREAQAATQEQSKTAATDLANKTKAEAQRRASEAAAAKAQEQLRAKAHAADAQAAQRNTAETNRAAHLEAQQRAKEAQAAKREQSRIAAKELQTKNQTEAQRRASDAAAANAKELERIKANGSEAKTREESLRNALETERLARLEAQQKAQGRPDLQPKNERTARENVRTNTVKKAQAKKVPEKPLPPETQPEHPPVEPPVKPPTSP